MQNRRILGWAIALVMLLATFTSALSWNSFPQIVRTEFIDGVPIDLIVIPGSPPPANWDVTTKTSVTPLKVSGVKTLSGVPTFTWVYGCSATAAAMMAGYYDRNGYPNIYTGPTNGGVCPLDNSSWGPSPEGMGECPLSATHQGIDGRGIKGHADDYYYESGSTVDPYDLYDWTPHEDGDCTADYMKTSRFVEFGLQDGATGFYNDYTFGNPFSATLPVYHLDGALGLKTFFESRGYTVLSYFNQPIEELDLANGYSFEEFQAEIDAGHPVLIQLVGHTVLGVGYDAPRNVVYIHNTWDYSTHEMTWGGSYAGMAQSAVTVIHLASNQTMFDDGFESGNTSTWSSSLP